MLFHIVITLGVLAQVGVFAIDDRILEPSSNATSVVLLTAAYLQQTTVFSDDNGMLRRIAYVETRDGARLSDNIWAVSEEGLQLTQASDHPTLNVKHNLIFRELDIDWIAMDWEELQRPLYSAVAARLLLFLAPERLPDVNDIEGQAAFWKKYYNTNGSVSEFAGASFELEGNVLESYSSEFFVAFGRNDDGGRDSPTLRLFISSIEPDPVLVTVETLRGFTFSGFATNNETLSVEIPNTFQVFSSDERDKGIRVTADGQSSIVIYGLNYANFTSDAFLALPCDRLPVDQYEYYGVSYSGGGHGLSHILIVGCENGTVFQIGSQVIEINQMESYFWESGSVTGTRVISNKPLVVYAGHRCTDIPFYSSYCDHITEQVPPTAIWGTTFMSSSYAGRASGDLYRILASQTSTSVTVNCSTLSEVLTYNLDTAGSWQEFTTADKSFCSITSDKPLLVMQFALGNNEDGIGDPFMMMITPVEQYSNNYVFNVLPEFEINYITLYVTPEDFQPESIFVDDTNLENSTWVAVYYSSADICGYITSTSLLPGEHQLYHADVSSQIGVSAYGFNAFNSYGYPGGLQLEPVQLAIISFSQSEFTVLENEEFARVKLVRSGDISREAVVLIGSDPYKGDAAARSDYMPIIEILTFLPEELTKRVDVVINDDTNVEFDESFFLYLVSGEGVHLSPFQRAKVVIRNDDGKITLTPRYGSEIGGTPIIVTGDKITASAEDNVTCVFDGIETDGFVTKDGQVLCVSPEMRRTGRVPFKLHIEGEKNMFNGISIFRSVPHERAAGVSIETNPLITSGDMVRLRWSKEAILPTERHDRYTINVALGEYDENSAKWVYTELAKDMPNTGYIEIAVPERSPKADNDSGSPVVFQIGVSESSTETQIRKRGIFRNIIKNVIRGITFVTKVYILVKYPKTEVIRRAACELWGLAESREASLQILSELPPCPCTVSEINGNIFKQESIASVIFHPDSDKCFRQRMPSTTAGQQCCYDEDGDIIVGQDSGGTIDFVAPKDFKTTIGHFFVDVVPHIFCCTPLLLSKCEKYYEFRPSDDCSRTRPQRPAFARGDPHLVTLDGLRYTFNGRGEFTLIETQGDMFTLQGRMTLANGVNNSAVAATVFSAIAAKDNDSDTVQFEVDENNTLIAIVSGELIVFDLAEQEFEKVTVQHLGENSIEALFASGAYVVAGAENGFIATLQVILLEAYSGQVQGLLGTYNGDVSDDLLPQFGDRPLPPDSSMEDIHNEFGVTWIVDSATKSLFVYQPEHNWDSFYDPYFVPSFEPNFSDPTLESKANEICGDDSSCLFDIAATGNIDVGISTLESSKIIDEIYTFLLPVVCSSGCEFGACVANDTCKCSDGYAGKSCSEKVVQTCEENICENGGSCTRHVNDYTCMCSPGFSGFLCEEALGESDNDESGNTGTVVGVSVVIVLLALVSMTVVVVIFLRRARQKRYGIKSEEFDVQQLEMSTSKEQK